ncbi:MAG: histidinol dehydrogenase [Tuberibacillus sp.]
MIANYTVEEFKTAFLGATKKAMDPDVLKAAEDIINQVRNGGDTALRTIVQKFDGMVPEQWEVTDAERKAAWDEVPEDLLDALERAAANIKHFHAKQLQNSRTMELSEDIISGQLFRPIQRVGIYVPGGTAIYPSTVLMNAVPAVLAGVNEVVMVSPARQSGHIDPVLIVAADIAGVHKIYKIGGAQAIAALAYGTETIRPVDKIVGPGNQYVSAAKSLVFGDVGIDMIAGPSEVAIIADDTANPAFVAADLIAQAEHDANARTFLFSTSESLIEKTGLELEKQASILPRNEIIRQSFTRRSALVCVKDIQEAFTLVNQLAPEHLEIQLENPMNYLGMVKNAGSVFLGHYTPEALGDYFAGPNHVLPTAGTARFSSGLSVDDFMKKMTYLYYSEKALNEAAPFIDELARKEQLYGHAEAVKVRLKK